VDVLIGKDDQRKRPVGQLRPERESQNLPSVFDIARRLGAHCIVRIRICMDLGDICTCTISRLDQDD